MSKLKCIQVEIPDVEDRAERAAQPTSAMTRFPQMLFLKLPLLLNSAFQAMCAFSADLNFRLAARHTGREATSYAALCPFPLQRAGKSQSTGLFVCPP